MDPTLISQRANRFGSTSLTVGRHANEIGAKLQANQLQALNEQCDFDFSEFLKATETQDPQEAARKIGEAISSKRLNASDITGLAGGTRNLIRYIKRPETVTNKLYFKEDIDKLFSIIQNLISFFDALFQANPRTDEDYPRVTSFYRGLCQDCDESPNLKEAQEWLKKRKEQFQVYQNVKPELN